MAFILLPIVVIVAAIRAAFMVSVSAGTFSKLCLKHDLTTIYVLIRYSK